MKRQSTNKKADFHANICVIAFTILIIEYSMIIAHISIIGV